MAIFEFNINHSNDFINFISPIIGVIISAFIAWCTYKKQMIEKEVKANIATFSYMFSLICKNFEELYNIKEQISAPALEEIGKFLETLNTIENYMCWAIDGGKSPIQIQLPKEEIRPFAIKQVENLSQNLVLKIATRQHFIYMDTTNFKKEAVLLSQFGDLNFGTVSNRLDTEYNVISEIHETIKQYNEENIEKPRSVFNGAKIITSDENYKKDINNFRGQMLYRQSLFESYDTTVTRCLIMSYNAACHLEAFFYHYLKKHCVVTKKLGVPFKTLQLNDESFFPDEKFQLFLNTILPQEYPLFSIPLYRNLKRNFLDGLSDFIFYFKWK